MEPWPEGDSGARALATTDGYCWTEDIRLTNDTLPDSNPAISVDSSGNANLIWYRSGNPGTHYYVKVDKDGRRLFDNISVGTGTMPIQETGQVGHRSGTDGSDDFHILWTYASSYGPMYRKYDAAGEPLTSALGLSGMASMPHSFGMEVGANGFAYIAYVNEGSQRIEMAYLDLNATVKGPFFTTTTGEGVVTAIDGNDCPHTFSWDTHSALNPLYMTKFSPGGAVLIAPRKVETSYPIGRYDRPVPSVAIGPDGAIHLLQANSTSGTRTLMYRKLSADGVSVTPSIQITDAASGYGDVSISPDNATWISWGDADDGKLWYLRLEPGNENETDGALVLTEGGGRDMDPRIAFGRDGRVHVAWVSDREGTRNVYYKSGVLGGLELGMTQDEMESMFWFHPDRARSANLTVRNLCALDDTVQFLISADFHGAPGGVGRDYNGTGWKVWIQPQYETMGLFGLDEAQMKVNVRSPSRGAQHERIDISVKGTSGNFPGVNDSLGFSVCLAVDHEVRLACADDTESAVPGTEARFAIEVHNLGDIDDDIFLSAESNLGWPMGLSSGLLSLGKGGSAGVSLTVSIPKSARAGQSCVITVTGESSFEPFVQGSVKITVAVLAFMDLSLIPDRDEAVVEPGGVASFWLTLEARSDLALAFYPEASTGLAGWRTELKPPSVFLDGNDSDRFEVRVLAPADAQAGARCAVYATCADAKRMYNASCSVTAVAGQWRRLAVAPSTQAVSLDPGGSASFSVEVVNLGNGPDTARLALLETPAGWECSVAVSSGSGEAMLPLGLNGSGRLWLELSAPTATVAGDYFIRGQVVDGNGDAYPFGLAATIIQLHGAWLSAPETSKAGEQGQGVSFPLEVENTGNGPDSILLCATGLPAGWPLAQFWGIDGGALDRVEIDAFRTVRLSVLVTIPRFAPQDAAMFIVTATSTGGRPAVADLTLAVRKPDLVVAPAELPSGNWTPGTPVLVKVTVRNDGAAPAENVTLGYLHDGVLRTTENLGIIRPGAKAASTFVWVPEVGANILEFVADPGNAIAEANESNNRAVLTEDLARPKTPVPIGDGWNITGTAVIVIMVFVVVVLLSWMAVRQRRARPGR
jgi:uncharacterized membrane protein